jgi:hypothetical protein
VKAPDAGRLHAWLADPRIADVDPLTVEPLRQRLAAGADDRPLIAVEPHGSFVVREPSGDEGPPRRALELDRYGAVLATLRWREDGRLAAAWIRVAEEAWVMIEPRATDEPPWGLCDRLWQATHPTAAGRTALTVFEALAYERIDRIPVMADPGRLPAGAGTAVLNLVAALAADRECRRLAYRGPYPTEQLFLTLLESFRYHTIEADPLAAFMAGRVEWSPAPHERACPAPRVSVHLRGRVEKVAWRGRFYYRPDWQGVRRHAPRRVRDVDGAVVCSLWALGDPLEDHLRLDPEGTTVEVIAPPARMAPDLPLPAPVLAGVASAAAALGAAPLAPFVREVAAGHDLAWASLDADLVAVEGTHLRVSEAIRNALERRLRAATTRTEHLSLGLAALAELAQLIGDPLRTRAQARIAALPPETQARLLTEAPPAEETDDARVIVEAVKALIANVLASSSEP